MNKLITSIILIIIFLIAYLLQSNFFAWFTIAGVKPNLFVLLVIIIGLFSGKTTGTIFGVTFGILIDIYVAEIIGPSGIMLGAIGYLGGYLDKNFSKDSKLTIIIIIAIATIVFESALYLFKSFYSGMDVQMTLFLKILGIEVVYNMLLTIMLYPILLKRGI